MVLQFFSKMFLYPASFEFFFFFFNTTVTFLIVFLDKKLSFAVLFDS